MKHAGDAALDALEDVLRSVRAVGRAGGGLTEKKRGTFYRKSSAFLHFHEDPAGLFADVRDGEDWRRFPVNTAAERKTFLRLVRSMTQTPQARR